MKIFIRRNGAVNASNGVLYNYEQLLVLVPQRWSFAFNFKSAVDVAQLGHWNPNEVGFV